MNKVFPVVRRSRILVGVCNVKKGTPIRIKRGNVSLRRFFSSESVGGWNTLTEMQTVSCERNAQRPLFGTNVDNKFDWLTYDEFGKQVDNFRSSLALQNVNKGDRVALVCNNCVEWAVVAYGVYGRGGVLVPMYENQAKSDVEFILENSQASVLVVGKNDLLQTYKPLLQDDNFNLKKIICLEEHAENSPNISTFDSELSKGSTMHSDVENVSPDDISTLIYTSGTTGQPKGVMLTHSNLCSNVKAVSTVLGDKINSNTVSLAFLTWAHVFGQTMELHQIISQGGSMGLTNPHNIMTDIKIVKPTILVAVPVVYERIYEAIMKTVKKNDLTYSAFNMALKVAKERRDFFDAGGRGWTPLLWLKWNIVKPLVFDKIVSKLGGRLQWAATGGSKCPEEIQNFFDLCGIPLIEGYGSTETSPVLTMERYAPTEMTQGGQRPLPGISLKICDENGQSVSEGETGEICAAGPNIMEGYWNEPEKSAKAFYHFNDGRKFFRTGDSGTLRSDPKTAGVVLEIKGRMRSVFKLANGKFVNPDKIEASANESSFASQACAFGLNRNGTIMVIYPNQKGINELGEQGLVDALKEYLHKTTEKQYTVPKGFILLKEELSVENGFLTPKLSIKKNLLEEELKDQIDQLYKLIDSPSGTNTPFVTY